MNKKIFLFLIVFILINCEKIKFAITKLLKNDDQTPVNFIYDFRSTDKAISKDFVNKLRNQSPISITFKVNAVYNDEKYDIYNISVAQFPISLDYYSTELSGGASRGEFMYNSGGAFFCINCQEGQNGYMFGKIDISDDLSYTLSQQGPDEIVTSFYIEIETIGLKIENCLDPNEDYEIMKWEFLSIKNFIF